MPIAAGAGGGPHQKGGKSLSGCDHGRAAAAADRAPETIDADGVQLTAEEYAHWFGAIEKEVCAN
jgi:hypothetical protein